MSIKVQLGVSALLLALAVSLGAFGAHALEEILSQERLGTWETAVFYHTWNSLGLILITLVSRSFGVDLRVASSLILAGIIIFSGSLYILCLTNIGWFGAITPIGGVCLIIGWIVFGWKTVTSTSIN